MILNVIKYDGGHKKVIHLSSKKCSVLFVELEILKKEGQKNIQVNYYFFNKSSAITIRCQRINKSLLVCGENETK